jgi:hypothetical protein
MNTGAAILMLGIGYFYFTYNLHPLFLLTLALPVLTWVIPGFEKERELNYDLQNKKLREEIEYIKLKIKKLEEK